MRGKLLELFQQYKENPSEEVFWEIAGCITRIMGTPSTDNFSEIKEAYYCHPETFLKVLKALNYPQVLSGLLELYLAVRTEEGLRRELYGILYELRQKALREGNWSILEKFAEKGLVDEFATQRAKRKR